MTRNLTTILATAAILGGLATATAVLADERTPAAPPAAPTANGAMGGHGGMMGMMGQMSPDHMKQMTRMVENCNRMMESMNGASTGPNQHHGAGHPG